MRNSPGFLGDLQKQLEALPFDVLNRISRFGGLEPADLLDLILKPVDHTVHEAGTTPDEMIAAPTAEDARVGRYAMASGNVLGVVDATCALAEDLPRLMKPVLDFFKGSPVHVVASMSNIKSVVEFMSGPYKRYVYSLGTSFETLAVTADYRIAQPLTFVPCGPGDMVTLAYEFKVGAKNTPIVIVDPVGFRPDSSVIGRHITSGSPVTCQVEPRLPGNRQAVVACHTGIDQLVSQFRMTFDDPFPGVEILERHPWAWTGTAVLDAGLDLGEVTWRWHRRPITSPFLGFSFKRYFEDVTSVYRTTFVRAPS